VIGATITMPVHQWMWSTVYGYLTMAFNGKPSMSELWVRASALSFEKKEITG